MAFISFVWLCQTLLDGFKFKAINRELLESNSKLQRTYLQNYVGIIRGSKHLILFVLWCIWKNRNMKLWGRNELQPSAPSSLSMSHHSRSQSQIHKALFMQPNNVIDCSIWKLPENSYIKCNVDAALFSDT